MECTMNRQQFVKKAAEHGSYREKRADAGAALFEAFCKADSGNRRDILWGILKDAADYAEMVMGWSKESIQHEFTNVMKKKQGSL